MKSNSSHSGQDTFVYELTANWQKKTEEIIVMEVGARDGLDESNSKLFRDKGFLCLLGESDKKYSNSLLNLKSKNCLISSEPIPYKAGGLDAYIDNSFEGKCPDILFLDIDGGEYGLIETSSLFPEVVCVEYNRNLMPNSMFTPQSIGHGILKQASPLAIVEMMLSRGYELSGLFWNDMVFVKSCRVSSFKKVKPQVIEELIRNRLVIDPFEAYILNGLSQIEDIFYSLEEECGESDINHTIPLAIFVCADKTLFFYRRFEVFGFQGRYYGWRI